MQASVSPLPSPSNQPPVGSGQVYGLTQLSPSAPAYSGPYQPMPSPAGPSISSQKEHFPERPGQPDCQYYMRTGDCKFGSSCRYHHPPDISAPKTTVMLSSVGLPMRPVSFPCGLTTSLCLFIIAGHVQFFILDATFTFTRSLLIWFKLKTDAVG